MTALTSCENALLDHLRLSFHQIYTAYCLFTFINYFSLLLIQDGVIEVDNIL